MNRAERRRAGKTDKTKTYVLTQAQIDKMKADATEDAFKMLLSIPVTVLHDKFGFREVEMDQFMHYTLGWVEGVQKGEVTLTELLAICETEAGVTLMEKEK